MKCDQWECEAPRNRIMKCSICPNEAYYKIKGSKFCFPHGITHDIDDRYVLIPVRLV